MPRSINGTGTMYYGSALPEPDGSYIATEWITFFWLPILPLGSKRVWYQKEKRAYFGNQTVTTFKVAKVPLYLPHIYKGYAITLPLVLFFMVSDPNVREGVTGFFRNLT